MKKEDLARGLRIGQKPDSLVHVNNKVLPINDGASSSSSATNHMNDQCRLSDKKERLKGDKPKFSRMKELLRWAVVTAKTEKGGKYMSQKVSNLIFFLLGYVNISLFRTSFMFALPSR